MIMLNRVINGATLYSVAVAIAIVIIVYVVVGQISDAMADNSQFHRQEYETQLKQAKPLFQSNDLATILIWTGIDITKEITHIVETDNYIHRINPDLHFTTISHKTEDYKFIGVDRLALYIFLRDGIWSVYNVPFDDQYNPITKLYHSMLVEFYKTGEEILNSNREKAGKFKEGMMVF